MTPLTERHSLPLLAVAQAQKELTHNEALIRIDALLHPVVVAVGSNNPPATPAAGQAWVVGDAPTGSWSGRPETLAVWTLGGWRFVEPFAGFEVWSLADNLPVRFRDGSWRLGELRAARLCVGGVNVVGARQSAISAPSGGSVIDAEGRVAISAVLAAMRLHGLIES